MKTKHEGRIEMMVFEMLMMVVLVVAAAIPLFAVGWLSTPQAERVALRHLGPRAVWSLTRRGSAVMAPPVPYSKF